MKVEPACVKAISNGTTWRSCFVQNKAAFEIMGLKKDECNFGTWKFPAQWMGMFKLPEKLPESFDTVCLCSTDNCNGSGMIRSKLAVWLAGTIAAYILKRFWL